VEERLGQNRGASTQGFAFLILIGFDNMKRLSIWWPTLKTRRAGLVPLRSRYHWINAPPSLLWVVAGFLGARGDTLVRKSSQR
jgi:hypothetical protein